MDAFELLGGIGEGQLQLLVLLALYRRQSTDDVPCWEIRECSGEERETCPCYTVGGGQFCWFVGAKHCRPPGAEADIDAILPCMECPVVQRLLAGAGWGTRFDDGQAE